MPLPGSHEAVVGTVSDALAARRRGLQLRDTILVMGPGARVQTAFLFRQPLDGTVARNMLHHGTGALNIDACRVAWGSDKPSQNYWNRMGAGGTDRFAGQFTTAQKRAYADGRIPVPSGRWPADLVLVHGTECSCTGTKRIPGTNQPGSRIIGGRAWCEDGGWGPRHAYAFNNHDGTETVSAWDCEAECLVAALDAQSGQSTSPAKVTRGAGGQHGRYHPIGEQRDVPCYGDQGGASRFFPQLDSTDAALAWLDRLTGVAAPLD